MGRARKVQDARAARLLTGCSGSSPPRAAGRLQRRPGHDSPPRLPAGARGLAAVRGLPGSASGARSLGSGRRERCTDPRRPAKEQGLPEWPRQGPESRPPSPGDPCGRGRTESSAARPGGSEGPWRGLAAASPGLSPGWERARLSLARCYHLRRLGLAARRGDERRGWFLGEPRALPVKPPQGAKSKSQSPSLQTRRHPISWETATPNDKPRIFSLAHGGEFSTGLLGGRGTPSTDLTCRESREIECGCKPYPEATNPTVEPRAQSIGAGRSYRRRFVLTWIPRSW